MITQQIAEQAAKVSGTMSIATGTVTAGATAVKSAGLMEWLGQNALAIGALCTICTMLMYFIFGVININIQCKNKNGSK